MKITIEAYGHKTEVDLGDLISNEVEKRIYFDSYRKDYMVEIIKATFDKFIELIVKSMGAPDGNVLKEDLDPDTPPD